MVVTGLRDALRRVRERALPEHTEQLDRRLALLDYKVAEL
jgi:hypothetical protein